MKIVIALFAILVASPAAAIECVRSPDRTPGPFWRYRVIDNERCWYRSDSVLAKSELQWGLPIEPAQPVVSPIVPRLVPTISYHLDGKQPDPVFALPPSEPSRHTIARILLGMGMGLAIAGMFWPIRNRRNSSKHTMDYDARKDFTGSLNEGYRTIRARVAAGGPGWERGGK